MPELTREEKLKIFEKLPKELQDLMDSEDTGVFLLYLGNKYKLLPDKVHLLSKIVGNIILGILPLSNMVSEIASKMAIDQNIAAQIAQEINNDLFAPVANLLKGTSVSISTPQVSKPIMDKYREPTAGPEVIDLRKTPPPPMPMPVAAAPIPPVVSPSTPLRINKVEPPKPAPPLTFTKPIEKPAELVNPIPTFQPQIPKVEPPLIEADPHKIMPPAQIPNTKYQIPSTDTYREPIDNESKPPVVSPSTPLRTGPVEPPMVSQVEPQFIIRPPGLPPAPDIIDLKKDRGEF